MELTCFISLKHVAIVMYEYKSTSLLLLGTHFIVITQSYRKRQKRGVPYYLTGSKNGGDRTRYVGRVIYS